MRWVKPKLCQEPPPLKVGENRWVSDPLERAESLRDTLMARLNAAHDLRTWEDEQPESTSWDRKLSLDDVTACTIQTSDKSPGPDKITVRFLKACWTTIGEHVKDIFQVSLDHGNFSTAFRGAEIVFPSKPGRDFAAPKGWQPISLISYLGKGLGVIVAKWMALLAIKYKVVPQQLFVALPRCSVLDLVSCVIHDAEAAMRNDKVMAMKTINVQGAFDAVLQKFTTTN